MMSRVAALTATGLLLAASLQVAVAPAQQSPALQSQEQGGALADFATVLPRLPVPVRERLQQRAATWARWRPDEREAFIRRAATWDALPRSERIARREGYAAWRALSPPQRERLREAATRFQALPAERRQALRAEFAALDRSLQRGWLLGPELGADYAGLQPLLAQVPPAEHAALLETLRSMSGREREQLAVLVHRTPPQARATLRRELVSTAAANRREWLRSRLER